MADSQPICPRCGEPITVAREHRVERGEPALCDQCYFETFELIDVPDRIEVTYCAHCGAVKRGNRWVAIDADDRVDIAIDALQNVLGVHVEATDITWRVEPEQVDETTVRVRTQVTGTVRDTPIEESTVVPVKLATDTCPRCGRIAGDYYEGLVQLRAADRTPTADEQAQARAIARQLVDDAAADGDRDAFITAITPVDAGLDIKVSTTGLADRIATQIIDRNGGTRSTSETLVTEDTDGNELYRVTYAIRLPRYRSGDIIDPEDGDGPVLVTGAQTQLRGRRLLSGAEYTAPIDVTARILGRRSDGQSTTLVAIEDEHALQVLDPETYESRTIARPETLDIDRTTETIPVFKHGADLYPLPDDDV